MGIGASPASKATSGLYRRASRAHHRGDLAQACRLYDALLKIEPGHFDALHGLGQIHCQSRRFDTALVLIREALKIDGGRADGFASLGLVLHFMRRFKEALASYDNGLRIEPDNTELLNRRGVALLELGRPADALKDFERVLATAPDHVEALGNYGNALTRLNRPQEAIAAYERALTTAPDNAQLLTNRAVALRRLDRPQEALMSARRALVNQPDFAQARFVESVARLTLGDFGGWRGYEARWSVGLLASQRRTFTVPLWLGETALDGKSVLLHAEQGFGDTLQFVRYAPLLKAHGAKWVVVEVQRELVRLLSGMSGIDAVIARGAMLPPFDCHCPLLSLPLACATGLATIPADIPYIAPTAEDVSSWRRRLPQHGPRIGLVWAGDPAHDNDLNRSLSLETILPLLDVPDVSLVGLQHVVRDTDAALLNCRPGIVQIGTEFRDFADTAAAIAALDAIISVDTAIAHLAGAMGKPLFLLLPFAADFRWLRERRDSPWYPTARLYRQPQFGDWDSVVAAVRRDVGHFFRENGAASGGERRRPLRNRIHVMRP